ncbi:hypothetical protein V8E52_007853 [Russula decolorans]
MHSGTAGQTRRLWIYRLMSESAGRDHHYRDRRTTWTTRFQGCAKQPSWDGFTPWTASGVWADRHLRRPEKRIPKAEPSFEQGIRKATQVQFQVRPTGPSVWSEPGRGTRHSLAYGNADRLRDQVCCVANIPGAEMRLTQTLRELKQCYRTSMSMPLKVSSTLGQGFLLLRWLFFATEARWTRRGKRMKATFSAKSILRWQCDDVLLQYVRW